MTFSCMQVYDEINTENDYGKQIISYSIMHRREYMENQ